MNENPQLEYVKDLVKHEIDLYKKRERNNRGKAIFFTVAPASLAALATVSIGISGKNQHYVATYPSHGRDRRRVGSRSVGIIVL